MSKPLVEFGDPEAAIIAYLDVAYIGAIASRKPGTISTRPPQGPLAPDAWWLQVELDGTPTAGRWVESPTIRLNCHTAPGRRSDAKSHASLAFGLLGIHPGDDAVFNVVPLVGRSQPITDPTTKNLMVWGSFRVNMRPLPVSV